MEINIYCRSVQFTDNNMARAHCMLDTQVSKHTFRICNPYCFPAAASFTNAPQCYFVRTSRVLCLTYFICKNDLPQAQVYPTNDNIFIAIIVFENNWAKNSRRLKLSCNIWFRSVVGIPSNRPVSYYSA